MKLFVSKCVYFYFLWRGEEFRRGWEMCVGLGSKRVEEWDCCEVEE